MTRPPSPLALPALLLAAGLALPALAQPASGGGKAPDFSLKDLDGNTVSLSDFADKVVVLSFWATWCTPCKAEMPHLETMYKDYKEAGLVVLSISVDEARNEPLVKSQIRAGGYTFPVLLDQSTDVVTQYNPRKSVPLSVVIAKDGRIRATHEGYTPGDEAKLRIEVEELLGLGDPAPASDPASGSGADGGSASPAAGSGGTP